MNLLAGVILTLFAFWTFERFYLRGQKIGEYPQPADPESVKRFNRPGGPGPEHQQVTKRVRELTLRITNGIREHDLPAARAVIDSISDDLKYPSGFRPVDAGGVAAEWVLAPGADNRRRVLYIHGGGFIMGSPKSHRTITSRFSEVSGCAVLSIDYRLMPEFSHMDAVQDSRTAYRWILENGPDGPEEIGQLSIGGDSAGGNIALALVAWIRDSGLREADAVVALSPLTDMSFSGDSISRNEDTDVMLKPVMRLLNKLPRFMTNWWVLWTHRMRPANPVASPLKGDLSGLPPTLVQASEAEMLLDDARRYVYKACASGSPVKLQTWTDMVHIWQIFDPPLPQAAEAWQEIGKFIRSIEGPGDLARGRL